MNQGVLFQVRVIKDNPYEDDENKKLKGKVLDVYGVIAVQYPYFVFYNENLRCFCTILPEYCTRV